MLLFASHGIRASLIGLLCFIMYCFTLSPDVGFTDSGELAAVCSTLGVAHPTGYPLYTMVGYVWTLLPLPFTPVFKLNLFAAFCTAISVGLMYWCTVLTMRLAYTHNALNKSKKKNIPAEIVSENAIAIIASIISLIYGSASIIWHQSSGNEVYSLQLALYGLIIGLFLRAISKSEQDRIRAFMIWAMAVGLGFGNHGTTILLAPAMLFMFFKRPEEKFTFTGIRLKELLLLIIPFLIGLSVWLYVPLRSATLPDFNWGEVHRNWEKFWYHASGKQFQIWMFNGSFSNNAKEFFSLIPFQFGIIGLPIIIMGLIRFWKKQTTLCVFNVLLIITCLFYSFNYGIHDIEPYFALAIMGLLLLSSVGLLWFYNFLQTKQLSPLIAVIIIGIIPVSNLTLNYSESNKSNDTAVADYTALMIKKLPKNTLIISAQWDYWCSAFWYKQACENIRPDIVLIEKELLRRTWYPRYIQRKYPFLFTDIKKEMNEYEQELEKFESGGDYRDEIVQMKWEKMLNAIVTNNYDKRPVYGTMDVLQSEQGMLRGYRPIPEGLAFRIVKEKDIYTPMNYMPDFSGLIKMLKSHKGHLYKGMAETIQANLQSVAYYAERVEKNPVVLQYAQKQLENFSGMGLK